MALALKRTKVRQWKKKNRLEEITLNKGEKRTMKQVRVNVGIEGW